MKIAHLTSVHSRNDTRIFIKQCCSLSKVGNQVFLLVADGMGDRSVDGVSILDVGRPHGRLDRMWRKTEGIYRKALSLEANVYHLHDPELIPVGLRLKKRGRLVVFDSHEDVPVNILDKPYLNKHLRTCISRAFRLYQDWACAKLDGVVGATPFITKKFLKINANTLNINNYPLKTELDIRSEESCKKHQVCYVGAITEIRGARQMVSAIGLAKEDIRLVLAGGFTEHRLESAIEQEDGWLKVDKMGFLSRPKVREVLNDSVAGLVTLHPTASHIDSLPVKMFEYMSVGIPVIASNFPSWREIIEGNGCEICVDPLNPEEIAEAIDYLIANHDIAQQMGRNGRLAIENSYNWAAEEKKLFEFYDSFQANSKSTALF